MKDVNINFRLSREERDLIKDIANDRGVSVSDLIVSTLLGDPDVRRLHELIVRAERLVAYLESSIGGNNNG